MSKTKIVLSAKELEMVNDRQWILTKQAIIQQVYVLLESVVADVDALILPGWQSLTQQQAPAPRIFKGENYLGLPYVTLDHPRLFEADNMLTVRTMFWWGNFISITLHASGKYKESILEKVSKLHERSSELYICIHENQWQHHFEPDNYIKVRELSAEQLQELGSERDFIKVAYKLSLVHFNEMQHLLKQHYEMLAEIMA